LKDLEERVRREVTLELQAQFQKQLNEYDAIFKTGFNNSFSARAIVPDQNTTQVE